MTAILGHTKGGAIGKPGQLVRQLVALALRGDDFDSKAAAEDAGNLALYATDFINVGNDVLSGIPGHGGDEGDAAGRHVPDLAGIFLTIGKHEPAKQIELHTVMATSFFAQRQFVRGHGSLDPELGMASARSTRRPWRR